MKRAFLLFLAALMLFSACSCIGGSAGKDELTLENGVLSCVKTGGLTLRGLRLTGGSAGEGDDAPALVKNNRPYSLTDIRYMFEVNEWITFSLEYGYGTEYARFGVWIFKKGSIADYDALNMQSGLVYFAEYELPYETYPAPLEDEFTLDPSIAEAGEYEMMFTLNGKCIAIAGLRLFDEGALAGKTQEELETLVKTE